MVHSHLATLQLISGHACAGDFHILKTLFKNTSDYEAFLFLVRGEVEAASGKAPLHEKDLWWIVAGGYGVEKLGCLIKGLAVIEHQLSWGGSVSPIIFLYQEYIRKEGVDYCYNGKEGVCQFINRLNRSSNKQVKEITSWLLLNSRNSYIPFGVGTIRSRTLEGVKQELESWRKQKMESVKLEEERRKYREEQKVKRQKAIELFNTKRALIIKADREYRKSLDSLTCNELLGLIARDEERSIYFYVAELKKVALLEFDQDAKSLLSIVLNKFKSSETRKFKKLTRTLYALVKA